MGYLNDLADKIYDNGTDKGFHPKGAPPISDTAAALGIDLDRAVALKHQYNTTRPFRHGNKAA